MSNLNDKHRVCTIFLLRKQASNLMECQQKHRAKNRHLNRWPTCVLYAMVPRRLLLLRRAHARSLLSNIGGERCADHKGIYGALINLLLTGRRNLATFHKCEDSAVRARAIYNIRVQHKVLIHRDEGKCVGNWAFRTWKTTSVALAVARTRLPTHEGDHVLYTACTRQLRNKQRGLECRNRNPTNNFCHKIGRPSALSARRKYVCVPSRRHMRCSSSSTKRHARESTRALR